MRLGRHELTLEPRQAPPAGYTVLTAVAAIVAALALASVLFLSADASPAAAYRAIFSYAFLNPHGLAATVHRSIYLLFCTYAFLVPLRAGLWNIGLPGQVYAGGLAAFAVPLLLWREPPGAPAPAVVIALMIAAAAAAGAAAGGIAGVLRARFQVNEILVTMMLNSILFWVVAYMVKEGGPFMGATAEGESFTLPAPLRAPLWWGVPFTAAAALGAAALLDLLFARAALGYRIRAFGESPAAARYGGVNPAATSLLVFLLGGAFAGLAGYHNFAAIPGVYKIPGNYGYYGDLGFYGMISALIARGSALGAVPIAFLFGGLSLGARFAQGALRLPFGVDYALLGLLMMTFIGSHVLQAFRVVWRRRAAAAPEAVVGGLPGA
ncbi:MAG: ABC transporter permease [Armatimonadota bacterium]|nr:ABC transporter permease [Armatimonadota bacterium]MDR7452961.1 ABC transporter permease [Armatimonadota bacterium]MDR7496710.1 ABC transporter permease [Armatimonadota bacterium]MDR7511189.1 ABC transporter permease [Armatimonadota bacterium]